jgi:hypothetical protein
LNGPHVASVQFKRPRSGVSPRAARDKRRELQQQCLRKGNDENTPLSAAMTKVGTTFTGSCASQNPPRLDRHQTQGLCRHHLLFATREGYDSPASRLSTPEKSLVESRLLR